MELGRDSPEPHGVADVNAKTKGTNSSSELVGNSRISKDLISVHIENNREVPARKSSVHYNPNQKKRPSNCTALRLPIKRIEFHDLVLSSQIERTSTRIYKLRSRHRSV